MSVQVTVTNVVFIIDTDDPAAARDEVEAVLFEHAHDWGAVIA